MGCRTKLPDKTGTTVPLAVACDALTERVGFEPTVTEDRHTGFRDRHLKPLGHLSKRSQTSD